MILINRLDLLMLSVKTPLVDAVCATVCHRWREASDLWLDVYTEPRYRTLSALCGLEATLRAGLYDLSQYFYIGMDGRPSLPEFLAEPWRQSLPIRRKRARYYGGLSSHRPVRRLIDLRLYREAIREVFRQGVFESDHGAAIQLLTECYFALGEHEALIALHRSRRLNFFRPRARMMVEDAKACAARGSLGPVENSLEFVRRHPAGYILSPLLNATSPALGRHG